MLSAALRETEETENMQAQSEDGTNSGNSEELWQPVYNKFYHVAQNEIAVGFQCRVILHFRHGLQDLEWKDQKDLRGNWT